MAATRSTSKISPTWGRQTRKYFLKFLHATRVPPVERQGQRGKTCESPAWLIRLIGGLAVTCQEPTDLGVHRMTCRFWKELGGRQLRVPPLAESPWRARLKNIGYQLGTAPGDVLQIFPPEYLESRRQWRYDDEQSVGTSLARQANSARDHPRWPAWCGPGGHVEQTPQ